AKVEERRRVHQQEIGFNARKLDRSVHGGILAICSAHRATNSSERGNGFEPRSGHQFRSRKGSAFEGSRMGRLGELETAGALDATGGVTDSGSSATGGSAVERSEVLAGDDAIARASASPAETD